MQHVYADGHKFGGPSMLRNTIAVQSLITSSRAYISKYHPSHHSILTALDMT